MKHCIRNSFLLITTILGSCVLVFGQQQFEEHGHQHHNQVDNRGEESIPTICHNLEELVHNHAHRDAKSIIDDAVNEGNVLPDCFFYNARLYYTHQLASTHNSRVIFDSLLLLYDHWLASSRLPTMVLNWKGRDLRDFYTKQPDSLRKYCAMYKRIYEADKSIIHPYNLKVLTFCACDLHDKMDMDSLWHFTRYQAMSHHEGAWKASYKSLKRELIACPKMSCEKLHELLHPMLSSGKEGSEETHKIATILAQRGCKYEGVVAKSNHSQSTTTPKPNGQLENADDGIAVVTKKEETTQSDDPFKSVTVPPVVGSNQGFDFLIAKAKHHMEAKEYKEATGAFESALKIAGSPIEKGDCLFGMAIAADSVKDFASAKKHAMSMHLMLPGEVEGLKFLSQLYQKGEKQCKFDQKKEMAAFKILLATIAWSIGNSEEADSWREGAELELLYKKGLAKKGEKVMLGCFIQEEVQLP